MATLHGFGFAQSLYPQACNTILYLLNYLSFSFSDVLSFFVIILLLLIPCSCLVRTVIFDVRQCRSSINSNCW